MTGRLRVGIIGCGEISGLNAWGCLVYESADEGVPVMPDSIARYELNLQML